MGSRADSWSAGDRGVSGRAYGNRLDRWCLHLGTTGAMMKFLALFIVGLLLLAAGVTRRDLDRATD